MIKKRTFLIFLCALYASTSLAQITLTVEKNAPRAGDKGSYIVVETLLNDLEETKGSNQEWDFSHYIDGELDMFEYIPASEGTNPSRFPGANLIQKGEAGNSEGYISTATGISQIGSIVYNNGITIEALNTDPIDLIKFPLSYGTTYNGTFSGVINVEYMGMEEQIVQEGNTTIEADGYGTLILSNDTFQNTLRVKTIVEQTSYVEENVSFGAVTYYMWYSDTDRTPLAQYTQVIVDSELLFAGFSYLSQNHHTSITNNLPATGVFALYPNKVKAGEKIMLVQNASDNTQTGWQLLTVDGRVINSGIIDSFESSIPTSQLTSGIYLVRLTGANKQTTQKLIIE